MCKSYHKRLLVSVRSPPLFHATLGIQLWGGSYFACIHPDARLRQSAGLLLLQLNRATDQ
jgi:hypothetical protein